jgi:hypothetical protein
MPVFGRTLNLFQAAGFEGLKAVEWNKSMYAVGGYNGTIYSGATFRSPDGQNIEIPNPHGNASSITGRAHHGMVAHNNRIFVTGGYNASGALNDCWMYDGKWTRVCENIGGARYAHLMWSFDNRLYIAGGESAASTYYDDVWASYDGVTWRKVLDNSPTLTRSFSAGCVWDNKMWFVGGYLAAALRDVWCSVNGFTWEQQLTANDLPALCGHTVTVFDNKMVLIGGCSGWAQRSWTGVTSPSGLYYSENGSQWIRGADDLEFTRTSHAAFAFTDKQRLVVSCGTNGTVRYADIWQSIGCEMFGRKDI